MINNELTLIKEQIDTLAFAYQEEDKQAVLKYKIILHNSVIKLNNKLHGNILNSLDSIHIQQTVNKAKQLIYTTTQYLREGIYVIKTA